MGKEKDYIWYASYGSNISMDRFLCYIQGGKPKGASRTYEGCTDKSLPLDNKSIKIPHQLYFAKQAQVWNGGGVAFINPQLNQTAKTLGRMYLITKAQFAEVVMQENALDSPPDIPYRKVVKNGGYRLFDESWYNYLLCLGRQNDYPIFTFTHDNFMKTELNPPHVNYLDTIAKGIEDAYSYQKEEAVQYLISKIN